MPGSEHRHPHRAKATTLGTLLALAADQWGDGAVVVDRARLSFREFDAKATACAQELIGLRVGKGDRVGILMPNSMQYLLSLFAIAKVGAVPVPINHRFSAAELTHVIADSELEVLFVSREGPRNSAAKVVEAFPALVDQDPRSVSLDAAPRLRHVVNAAGPSLPGILGQLEMAEYGRDVDPVRVEESMAGASIREPAMIVYTSGTTAKPKGCVLTHEGLTRTAFAVAEERFCLTAEDRCWDPLPFCHLSSLVILNACLVAGATFISMGRFEPGEALAQLERERCTFAYPCFDTITSALQEDPNFAGTDLSNLKLVVTIGVPERLAAWQEGWPQAAQLGAYGATEYSGVLCYNRPGDSESERVKTCGPPIPGMEVRVVRPDTTTLLPDGERGELQCRGYGVFEGYYRDDRQTSRVLTPDGWFHSGDLVSKDSRNYVSYHGRLKDMIKVGGENVAAAEVEGVLISHPAVVEAQVVGIPDDKYVEVPVAFVEWGGGKKPSEADLLEHCADRMARFKLPRRVMFVSEWPMSETKIMKQVLRERATDLTRPSSPRSQGR